MQLLPFEAKKTTARPFGLPLGDSKPKLEVKAPPASCADSYMRDMKPRPQHDLFFLASCLFEDAAELNWFCSPFALSRHSAAAVSSSNMFAYRKVHIPSLHAGKLAC